jgi:hypothetical protein
MVLVVLLVASLVVLLVVSPVVLLLAVSPEVGRRMDRVWKRLIKLLDIGTNISISSSPDMTKVMITFV